jgi:hypothetical protein
VDDPPHLGLETEVAQEEGRTRLVLLPLGNLPRRFGQALTRYEGRVPRRSPFKVVGILDQQPPTVEMSLAEFKGDPDLVGV